MKQPSLRNPGKEKPQKSEQPAQPRPKPLRLEPMRPHIEPTIINRSQWQALYFADLEANGGQIGVAAEAAGITTSCVWRARTEDPDFARDEVEALRKARTRAEDAAIQRAIHGVVTHRITKPNGEVMEKIEFSDTLLIRLLEKGESGSWLRREKKVEQQGIVFNTRAERIAAIERARQETAAAQAKLGERRLSSPSENRVDDGPLTEETA